MRYALSRFRLSDERVQAIVQTARASGEGGAFEREPDIESPEPIPELRERCDGVQHLAVRSSRLNCSQRTGRRLKRA